MTHTTIDINSLPALEIVSIGMRLKNVSYSAYSDKFTFTLNDGKKYEIMARIVAEDIHAITEVEKEGMTVTDTLNVLKRNPQHLRNSPTMAAMVILNQQGHE